MACATSEMSGYEDAKFALDQGDYDTAIARGTTAVAENPNNYEAARVLASAYFGRSGISFSDLAEGIIDLSSGTGSNFQQIAGVLPVTATEADLRSAIETIEAAPAIDGTSYADEVLADAAFDLGMMEIVEQFSLGAYGSNYFTSEEYDVANADVLDTSTITEEDAANAQTDLLNFDNRLISAGVVEADHDFIREIRQTFCVLKDITAPDGFTVGEYQAFVGCQLSSTAHQATFNTIQYSADIANCDALDPSTQIGTVEDCYDEDTTLE